eukprot:Opistho-2@28520
MAPQETATAALLVQLEGAGRKEAGTTMAQHVKTTGLLKADKAALFATLAENMNKQGKTGADSREGACICITALCKEIEAPVVPYVLPLLPAIIELMGDKFRPVQIAAQEAGEAIVAALNPNAVRTILPHLLGKSARWQSNHFRMESLAKLVKNAPLQMQRSMGELVPFLSEAMWDLKPEVKESAKAAMTAACNAVDNRDIKPFIPNLLHSIENPKDVPETVHKLSATTFVQSVTFAALSVIAPLLVRGLVERSTATKRQCARIIENMTKLVDHSYDVAPFLPKLLPLLESAKNEVSDPECRDVCQKAYEILVKKGNLKEHVNKLASSAAILPIVKAGLGAHAGDVPEHIQAFVSDLAFTLLDIKVFEPEAWTNTLVPYLHPFVDGHVATQVVDKVLHEALIDEKGVDDVHEEEDAEELCNTTFSLAYGSKILLNNTQLKLMRGYRYGLVGQNDSGKTSLLRAIAQYKVDGFPPKDEVRTIFVETDIQGELSDLSVLDYIYADALLKDCGVPREQMAAVLNSVGFTDESPANITTPVGALSGGWKMKLALARAMLLRADILLLDEPTNHLDAYNVKWVEGYLNGLTGVTSIIVSHDSGLLDRVCTHIIQIDSLKLHVHKGNLSEFVKIVPEARSYFELKASKSVFKFPPPGPLDGINSKGKPIMKMTDITFTYPGASKPQLRNVTIRCSLSSRVACLGVNGAGKSTMIKLLTGELKPDDGSGEVWKHPNARVAYVAQHAFHHIESHLDKTPNEYIRWRYENGRDKEALEKITLILTPEEEAKMKLPFMVELEEPDGTLKREKKIVESFTENRREISKRIQYEVRFVNQTNPAWVNQQVCSTTAFLRCLRASTRLSLLPRRRMAALSQWSTSRSILRMSASSASLARTCVCARCLVARRSRSCSPLPCGTAPTCSSSTSPPTTSTASRSVLSLAPFATLREVSS